jgi:hypothetical protein
VHVCQVSRWSCEKNCVACAQFGSDLDVAAFVELSPLSPIGYINLKFIYLFIFIYLKIRVKYKIVPCDLQTLFFAL